MTAGVDKWINWSSKQIAERHKFLDKCLHEDPVLRDIHRLYQLLDGKSASLFTHVSIMIATCTFLAGSPTEGQIPEKVAFLISTAIYLYIAISLLKILDFNMYNFDIQLPDPDAFYNQHSSDIYGKDTDLIFWQWREFFVSAVKARGLAHKRALKWTRRLTRLVIIFVLIDVMWRAFDYDPKPILSWLMQVMHH